MSRGSEAGVSGDSGVSGTKVGFVVGVGVSLDMTSPISGAVPELMTDGRPSAVRVTEIRGA